jgi:flagellar basal body rod protein FlgG
MRARLEALDMLANNIANSSTVGFKADREFFGLYLAPELSASEADPLATKMPVIEKQWTDFSQGTVQNTGKPLDLALYGRGFFTVTGPSGPLYTRNGSFQLTASGKVATGEGYPLRTVGGQALQASSDSPIQVDTDGTVHQGGQVLGQLELTEFSDTGALAKLGSGYFDRTGTDVKPLKAQSVEVRQGQIEGSNVPTAESAVRLVSLMRQFEMLQKAVTLDGEMSTKSIQEVARVGS